MRYNLSLKSEIFDGAVQIFDEKLRGMLGELLQQQAADGSVTLKLNVYLSALNDVDDDGVERTIMQPVFDCTCTSAITQKSKDAAAIRHDLKLRVADGQLELRDLDENTLYDMAERSGKDGEENAADAG